MTILADVGKQRREKIEKNNACGSIIVSSGGIQYGDC